MSDSYKPFSNTFQGSAKTPVTTTTVEQSSNNTPTQTGQRNDETFITPFVRSLIDIVKTTKETIPQIESSVDNGFKSAAKGFVNTVDVVAIRDNYRKAVDLIDRSPPMLIVASATLLPIILFKKVPSVKDPALAAIGFGASMYYCYPELVSKGSKKVIELYKQQTEKLNNNNNNTTFTVATPPTLNTTQPPKDKQ